MNLESHIQTILEAALQAPSGENSQPWKFSVHGNTIELYNDEASDLSLYNDSNRGSYVAHGAAIENICIAASATGYRASVTLFPRPGNGEPIASIILTPHAAKNIEDIKLYECIPVRTSNRKPYKKEPLKPEHEAALSAAVQTLGATVLYKRITSPQQMYAMAVVGATNEEVMLQNKSLHQFFFSHLTWSIEEDAKKKVGFFIRTLELPMPVRGLFKLIRHWSVMKVCIALGFPKVVQKANAATNFSAAEFGLLTTRGDTPQDFVATGRTLQRIWLTATSLGVEMQVLTGTIFLDFAHKAHPEAFSTHEKSLIHTQIETLYSMLTNKREVVTCMFRIGYGESPSARATRYTLEERLM